jgi:hypothetical protein
MWLVACSKTKYSDVAGGRLQQKKKQPCGWWPITRKNTAITDHQPNGCILSCYRPPTTWLYLDLLQATSHMAVLCLATAGHQPHPCMLSCYRPPATSLYFVLLQATSHIAVFCLATDHQPYHCILSCYRPPATSLYFENTGMWLRWPVARQNTVIWLVACSKTKYSDVAGTCNKSVIDCQ